MYFIGEGRSEGDKLRKRSKNGEWKNEEDERSRIHLMKVKLGWG